jgi:hypothetical protein
MADHLALQGELLFAPLWAFYTTVLQFLHSLHFGHKSGIIQDEFPQHYVLVWRKLIIAWISQLGGLSIAGHIITHSVETRTNTRWPFIYKAMSHVTLPHMCELSAAPTLVP